VQVLVNAAGARVDKVNVTLGIDSRRVGGSRGAHLVVDDPALLRALGGRMVYFGTADGRVNLLYPYFYKVLLGATDIA
jgi:glycerol-3-phosphate dehydrogenase